MGKEGRKRERRDRCPLRRYLYNTTNLALIQNTYDSTRELQSSRPRRGRGIRVTSFEIVLVLDSSPTEAAVPSDAGDHDRSRRAPRARHDHPYRPTAEGAAPLRTPWRAPAHSRARTRFRQCEKGLTRRRDSAARLGSGLEGTAGQPPRSAIAVASTQPSTSPVTAARVADGEPGGGLDGGCGHHANLRRDDQSAPRASTAGVAELGARGERGSPRARSSPPTPPYRPSPRAPRAPASAMRRPRRRLGLRDLRLTAVPFKPQSPGLLIVPGALHARLSILGGGRR